MKTLYYIIPIIIFPLIAFSQDVQVYNFRYNDLVNKDKKLDYLNDEKDTLKLTYIAELQIIHSDLYALYYKLHHKSTALGAEIYRVKSLDYDSTTAHYNVRWDIYHSNDSIRNLIRNKAEKNMVYIFSFPQEGIQCKVENYRIDIPASHYIKYNLEGSKDLKINKGGFLGTTQYFERFDDNSNHYIYFGGAELSPVAGLNYVGVALKTGEIYYHEIPVGIFLSKVFKEFKEKS